jgi:hypothetical protein
MLCCVMLCALPITRRQELEAASRTWIAPEDLQTRIAQALDNPQQL